MNRRTMRIVWLPIALLAIVAMLAAAACDSSETREVKAPDTFTQATVEGVSSLDPAYAYDSASGEQIQAIYEPLIYYDGEETTEFVGVLATEWNVSEDGKTYRFKIRENVKFHNGNDLTPEDVEYSFERGMVQDRAWGPQKLLFEPLLGIYSSRDSEGALIPLEGIENSVEVEDGGWVKFNLAAPYEPFMQILCGSWGSIVDKEWCVANGDWDGTATGTAQSYDALNDPENESPLAEIANGTGPFKLHSWDRAADTITLKRHDDYWGTPASFETVVTKVVQEWTTRKLELLQGDVDWAYVPTAFAEQLEGQEGITAYTELPRMTAEALFFQFQIADDSPYVGSGTLDGDGIPLDFFTDVDVRIAFNYAFDWDTYINDVVQGDLEQTASPAIGGMPYVNPDQEMYSNDLAKAEEHLRDAWEGQVWEQGFKFTIAYDMNLQKTKTAAEILRDSLATIDPKFKIELEGVGGDTFFDQFLSGQIPLYQMAFTADFPDPHSLFSVFMHSEDTFAPLQGYASEEVDGLIEGGIHALPADREQIYYDLQQIYHEDAPGIMLGQQLVRCYFRDWVQGFILNPMDYGTVGHIYNLSKGY